MPSYELNVKLFIYNKIFIKESVLFRLLLLIISFFWLEAFAHDPKNCDVLQNYDFSKFNDWKKEVILKSVDYGLDKNFVTKLINKVVFF